MDQKTSEIILFFGRFHPLILHLPIGFLVLAFILEVLSRVKKFGIYKPAVGIILLLGAISAAVAAALGYMLAQAGGYNEDLLFIHQWAGIGLALAAFIAFALYRVLQKHRSAVLDKLYLSVMVVMMIALSVAGHYGGSLTHGSGYLTQYMPNGLRNIAGLPPNENNEPEKISNLKEALVFQQIIYPILDARCVSCHNESKKKGDLMMHTPEALLKGGENGAVLVAGNAGQSELMKRIHLPEHDEAHMPPSGKSQLTSDQIKLLTWWINEGATFDKTVAEVKADEAVKAVLATLVNPDAQKSEAEILLASEIEPADKQKIVRLKRLGVRVMPLSVNTNWLQVKVTQDHGVDSTMNMLTGIADQLTWLNLQGTASTDRALAGIGQFKNLTRLHLENTKITDQGLQHLKLLSNLEYLNLYGTQVSNEGIMQLSDLENLRKLYLWQTRVDEKGIRELKLALPQLEVIMGFDQPENKSEKIKADKSEIRNPKSEI